MRLTLKMADERCILLICLLTLLAVEIKADSCSSATKGSLNGVEFPQQPIVLSPTQTQYLLTVPQNACGSYRLVGMYVKACSNDDSLSVQASDPWRALVTRGGVIRGNANVYLSIFCA